MMNSKHTYSLCALALAALVNFAPSILVPAFAEEPYDPIEPVNRGIFWANDKLDVNVIEPVAQGYHDYVHDDIRDGVGNFFENLRYPKYLVSDLLQLKFGQAATHTGRFLVNTTVGLLGIFDVADEMGLERHEEDIGIAFAYWGIPSGPYLVLPILGPSNLRDTVGLVGDMVLDPVGALGYWGSDSRDAQWIGYGVAGVRAIDQREGLLEAIKAAKDSSTDYYLFLQSSYYQYRAGVLYDGEVPDEFDAEQSSSDEPSADSQ